MKQEEGRTLPLLETLYKYLIAGLLIFIPLYPKFPLFNVPFTYVAIRAEDFLIAFTFLVLILKLIVAKKIKLPAISPQIGVFIFIGLISSISAILLTQNVKNTLVLLHFARRIEYLLAFFLVYYAAKHEKNKKFFFELVLLPAIGVFLFGFAQKYFNAPVISTMDEESSKGITLSLTSGVPLSSTFAGHYDLAVYLSMIMIFLAAAAAHYEKWIKRLPAIAGFSVLMWLFMQTGSRISLAGLFFAVILVCLIYKRIILAIVLSVIIGIGVFTSPQLLGRFQNIFSVFVKKTSQAIAPSAHAAASISPSATPTEILPTPTPEPLRPIQQDRSTSIRFDVEWPRAMRSFYKSPLFGTGYSSLTLATDNDYLRALGETGILGFIAFISIFIGLGKALFHRAKDSSGLNKIIAVSCIGILSFFLITSVFLDVFEASKIAILFWAFMGLAISIKTK